MTQPRRGSFSVVAVATLLFAAALGARSLASVWITTGVAAVLSLLVWWRHYGRVGAIELLAGRALPDAARKHARSFSPLAGASLGAAAGVVMVVGTHAAYEVSTWLIPRLAGSVRARYAELLDWPGPLAAMPILVVVVVAEECIWRGALFDALPRHWSEAATLLVATVLYALPQLVTLSPVVVAAGVVCGVFWGALRLWTGGLPAPIVAHLVWDFGVFLFWPVE